jgi:acyl-homoserine-lactone acylase
MMSGGTMRIRPRRFTVLAVALLTASAALPATAANGQERQHSPSHPSAGGLSAVIRYTEYSIPHILAKNHADLGFGVPERFRVSRTQTVLGN